MNQTTLIERIGNRLISVNVTEIVFKRLQIKFQFHTQKQTEGIGEYFRDRIVYSVLFEILHEFELYFMGEFMNGKL